MALQQLLRPSLTGKAEAKAKAKAEAKAEAEVKVKAKVQDPQPWMWAQRIQRALTVGPPLPALAVRPQWCSLAARQRAAVGLSGWLVTTVVMRMPSAVRMALMVP